MEEFVLALSSRGVSMRDRVTSFARSFLDGVSDALGIVRHEVLEWVNSGDVTAILVLSAVALVALFVLVAPRRRRY